MLFRRFAIMCICRSRADRLACSMPCSGSTRATQYLERISWIQAARRDISLTSDLIVGFPGETEAEFEETLSLMDVVGYDSVFTFKYSPRPNTPALASGGRYP